MRANYKIPARDRCKVCKGWGVIPNFTIHVTGDAGYRPCEECDNGWVVEE